MIAREPLSELARNLGVLHNGKADSEVVRWLRAQAQYALNVPAPASPEGGYTRSLLYKDARFEIVVIHWQPGCATAIHDHGGAQCWFAVCDGAMHIENFLRYDTGATQGYARLGLEGRESLGPGGLDYRADDTHLHRCIAGTEPVTTLHVYAAPIERFHVFDERTQSCSEMCSTYDANLTGG